MSEANSLTSQTVDFFIIKMFRKSQISVEYLLIIGFVVIILVPLVILYETYTSNSSDEIINSQIIQIERKIVDAAESVYFFGVPSQTTIKVYIPKKIERFSLDNKEIALNVSTRNGIVEIVQVSSVNLNGSLPKSQGVYSITLKALNTSLYRYVNVSYT